MSELAKRVERGAVLLDERWPGWWNEVDTGQLDIDHCLCCVLGQLWGDYDEGQRELFGDDQAVAIRRGQEHPSHTAVRHGFNTTDRWAAVPLTNLWRAAIERRRGVVVTPTTYRLVGWGTPGIPPTGTRPDANGAAFRSSASGVCRRRSRTRPWASTG
jgi:hypothetical protein